MSKNKSNREDMKFVIIFFVVYEIIIIVVDFLIELFFVQVKGTLPLNIEKRLVLFIGMNVFVPFFIYSCIFQKQEKDRKKALQSARKKITSYNDNSYEDIMKGIIISDIFNDDCTNKK